MSAHGVVVDGMLGVVVISTWAGVVGMWRMPEPMQALHYISLPGSVGVAALTAAVFAETGMSSEAWKMLLIAIVMLGINSVVTHATARAFRTRELGHWQPKDGDPMEFVSQAEGADGRGERRR